MFRICGENLCYIRTKVLSHNRRISPFSQTHSTCLEITLNMVRCNIPLLILLSAVGNVLGQVELPTVELDYSTYRAFSYNVSSRYSRYSNSQIPEWFSNDEIFNEPEGYRKNLQIQEY